MKSALSIIFVIFSFWLLFFAVKYVNQKPVTAASSVVRAETQTTELDADKLMELINDWREESGYKAFKKSDTTCKIANIRIGQVRTNYSHDSFSEVVNQVGISGVTYSENIINAPTEEEALRNWLKSPSHASALKGGYNYACTATDASAAVLIFSY